MASPACDLSFNLEVVANAPVVVHVLINNRPVETLTLSPGRRNVDISANNLSINDANLIEIRSEAGVGMPHNTGLSGPASVHGIPVEATGGATSPSCSVRLR